MARSASSARSRTASTSASERGAGTAQLGHHAPGPGREDDDAVAQAGGLLDVVGHEQHRARLPAQRLREPVLHLAPRQRVERGERLVEAQHRLARQQRAQEGHALAHAARELVGAGALEALQAEGREERVRAGARLVARRPAQAQRERRVVDRAQPRQQVVALGHEHRGVGAHAAGVGRLQPAHELEQRRLAAAAGPDDGDDLAGADLEVDAVERAHRAERAADARQACRSAPFNVSRLLRRSLELGRHRSLRGHYPTGSKGQRRFAGRYLSRPPPAPLLVCDGC